jgi:heme A synthase
MAFGIAQVFIGTAMARTALAARAQLAPWRGRLIVAASLIVLGVGLVASRGEVRISSGIAALCSIIGCITGSLLSIREGRRDAGTRR